MARRNRRHANWGAMQRRSTTHTALIEPANSLSPACRVCVPCISGLAVNTLQLHGTAGFREARFLAVDGPVGHLRQMGCTGRYVSWGVAPW
jgi:hypothetical protein